MSLFDESIPGCAPSSTVLFILLVSVLTVVGISQLVAPKLRHTEEQVALNRIAEVAGQIQGELNKVQAQQRSITQTIPLLDSAAIDTVLPGLVDRLQHRDQSQRVEFDNNGEPNTFFMRPIEGTPWFLATALPTKLITAQRDDVLSTLSLLQMVILLVLSQIYAIRQLIQRMKALKANIDALSAGDADLTQRITIRAEDELGAIGHSGQRLHHLHLANQRNADPPDSRREFVGKRHGKHPGQLPIGRRCHGTGQHRSG